MLVVVPVTSSIFLISPYRAPQTEAKARVKSLRFEPVFLVAVTYAPGPLVDMNHAPRLNPASNVTFLGGDSELVAGLKALNPAAQRSFFGRYSRFVERVLRGVLGPDADLGDVMQDTFLAAFRQVAGLRSPEALTEWLRTIAVGVAQNRIRSRKRNRWLTFFAPEKVPEPVPLHAPPCRGFPGFARGLCRA